MTNFVPWSLDAPPDVSWAAFVEWERVCLSETASYVDRSRYATVQRLKQFGRERDAAKALTDAGRKRNRKLWGEWSELDIDADLATELEQQRGVQLQQQTTLFDAAMDDILMQVERSVSSLASGRADELHATCGQEIAALLPDLPTELPASNVETSVLGAGNLPPDTSHQTLLDSLKEAYEVLKVDSAPDASVPARVTLWGQGYPPGSMRVGDCRPGLSTFRSVSESPFWLPTIDSAIGVLRCLPLRLWSAPRVRRGVPRLGPDRRKHSPLQQKSVGRFARARPTLGHRIRCGVGCRCRCQPSPC